MKDTVSIMEYISGNEGFWAFLELLSVFLPGFAFLFIFQYEIFSELDIIKLLLVSIFYSLPPYLFLRIFFLVSSVGRFQDLLLDDLEKIQQNQTACSLEDGLDNPGKEKKKLSGIAKQKIDELMVLVNLTRISRVLVILFSLIVTYVVYLVDMDKAALYYIGCFWLFIIALTTGITFYTKSEMKSYKQKKYGATTRI